MNVKLSNKFKGLSWLALIGMLVTLLVACGDEPTAAPTATTAPTTAAKTQPASTAAATTAATTAAATTAAATTTTASSTAPATTARATTVAATTAAATTAAPTTKAVLPPIGNNYPAGPAPTAAPPVGGGARVTLQVPDQLKRGVFATARTLQVPAGFNVSLYSLLPNGSTPRLGTVSPDGLLFVSLRGSGQIVILKDNGSGFAANPITFASGLNGPHDLAFHEYQGQMYLYVAENNRVSRFPYKNGQTQAEKRETIVPNLPTGGNHTTRSIAFGPDGKMYIAAGSSCNVCEESDPHRAAVTQYNADGTGERIFAKGMRNEVGIAFNPDTGELWGTENSRDYSGNNLPPEEINIIKDGGDYGWPYCFSNQVYDSDFGRKNADYCKQTIPPALPMQAHSAPLGITFYNGSQFPASFKGSAFVAFHGSWNRQPKTGYKVVQVQIENGRPTRYSDFVTGWLNDSNQGEWGRPAGVIAGADGSLFITDDSSNAVYRVTYNGKAG